MNRNRKPADEIADLRALRKEIDRREEELRLGFINGTLDPVGDEYEVEVHVKSIERVNVKALRRILPPAALRPFLLDVPTHIVHSKVLKLTESEG